MIQYEGFYINGINVAFTKKLKTVFSQPMSVLDNNDKMYNLLCALFLLIYTLITVFDIRFLNPIVISICLVNFLVIGLTISYLFYQVVLKRKKHTRVFRLLILFFGLTFSPLYTILLGDFGVQWITRLTLRKKLVEIRNL